MSSRALRKAQREREEQERLQKLAQEEQAKEGDVEEDVLPAQPAKKSAFAMLAEDEDEDENELDDVHADHEDAEKEDEGPQDAASDSIRKPTTNKKKKKKKKKSKGTPNELSDKNDDELDDIDKALRELSTNGHASRSATTVSGINQETDDLCKLLAIDSSHLHAQNEMRRLFGRAALEDREDEPPPPAGNNRRQQRQNQRIGLAQALRGQGAAGRGGVLSQMALKRNIFVQGKDEWPNATSGGLGMEVEEKRADGTVQYRFVHNRAYQEVQSQFDVAVESMDPNRLVAMLQQTPYHISTLLQVSEIAKQDRENALAGDLLERALFSFGRAVHSSFAKNLAEGKARLDFRRPENREFWLAGWRYLLNLGMRATWRTVYEWAKLLLSLSPEEDPYGMLLVLDQYALRARQDLDYLNLARSPAFKSRLADAPNSQLSQGLAEFRAGNPGKGKQALYTAVGRFPWVVARLMQENNIPHLPPAIWGQEPRTEREKLLSELYATRAKDIWNTPEAGTLLLEVASALPPSTPSAAVDTTAISLTEARHVLLSDTPALTALIPRTFTARLHSSSDPLPPTNSYSSSTPARSTETSLPAFELELDSLVQFLAANFPGRELRALQEEYVQPVMDAEGAERGARIVEAARRLETLRRRREGLEGDGEEDGEEGEG